MNRSFVSLCPEITRADALTLMGWLDDESVTRHLSDSPEVSRLIEQVIGRVQLPILTHLINQGGRFFMVCDRRDVPVGFVRLVKRGPDGEMVLVIGNRDNWGRQLGSGAIHASMKLAFLEMRAEKLIARIHADNARSLKALQATPATSTSPRSIGPGSEALSRPSRPRQSSSWSMRSSEPSSSIRRRCRGMSSR